MPKWLEDDFRKIDDFLALAKRIDTFANFDTIYELFGIGTNDSYPEIEGKINEFKNKYSGSTAVKFKDLGRSVSNYAETIKRVLKEHKNEYNEYLKENHPKIKRLFEYFQISTKYDNILNTNEKDALIKEAEKDGLSKSEIYSLIDKWKKKYDVKEAERDSPVLTSTTIPFDTLLNKTYYELLGLPEDVEYQQIKEVYDREYQKYISTRDKKRAEARWVVVSEAWECLRDPVKRREYDKKLGKKGEATFTREGDPKLEIVDQSGTKKTNFEFKNMRLGSTPSVTLLAKNGGGGTLDAKVNTNCPWLIVDTNRIHQSNLPQKITITVDPSKDGGCNRLGGSGNGEIKITYSKGDYEKEEIISVNFDIEIEDKVLGRFRKDLSTAFILIGIPVGHIVQAYFYNQLTLFLLFVLGVIAGRKVYRILSDEGGWMSFLISFAAFIVYAAVMTGLGIVDTYHRISLIWFLLEAPLFFLLGRSLSKKLFHHGKDIIHIIWISAGVLSLLIIFVFNLAKLNTKELREEQKAKKPSEETLNEQKASKIKPSKLFVKTEPTDCSIKIMNIKREFHQGIDLEPGRYHIDISAAGYKSVNKWVELGASKTIYVTLEKKEKIITDPNEEEQKAKIFFEEISRNRHRLNFFESGYIRPKKIFYQSVFHKNKTRYINYLLTLKHKAPGCRIEFPIVAVYKRSSGTIFARFTNNSYVERASTNSYHSLGNGWKKAGNWPIDSYKVDLFVKGKRIVSGNFKVID